MPDSLGAALVELEKDEIVRDGAMPGRLSTVFHHYKRDEWERYLAAVTDWERDEYLEVLPVRRNPCAGSPGSSTATAVASTRSGAT